MIILNWLIDIPFIFLNWGTHGPGQPEIDSGRPVFCSGQGSFNIWTGCGLSDRKQKSSS